MSLDWLYNIEIADLDIVELESIISPPQSRHTFSEKMNIFSFTFYVVPELLLGVLLIGAKTEGILGVPWKFIFIPLYIAALALLALLIVDQRHRRHIGEKGIGRIVIQLSAWFLVIVFLGLLVSKLDSIDDSFSWSLILGPLMLLVAICAVFEITSCCSEGLRSYNALTIRMNKRDIFLWLVAEIGVLLFLFLLGLKLDILESEEEEIYEDFTLGWTLIFVPLWVSFVSMFFIIILLLMNKNISDPKNGESTGITTIIALIFWWFILMSFFILLEIEITWPGNIATFALILPLIIGLSIMLLSAFCLYKKNKQEVLRRNVLDFDPLVDAKDDLNGKEETEFSITEENASE